MYIGQIVTNYKELIKLLELPIEQVTDNPKKNIKTEDLVRALSNQNKAKVFTNLPALTNGKLEGTEMIKKDELEKQVNDKL